MKCLLFFNKVSQISMSCGLLLFSFICMMIFFVIGCYSSIFFSLSRLVCLGLSLLLLLFSSLWFVVCQLLIFLLLEYYLVCARLLRGLDSYSCCDFSTSHHTHDHSFISKRRRRRWKTRARICIHVWKTNQIKINWFFCSERWDLSIDEQMNVCMNERIERMFIHFK